MLNFNNIDNGQSFDWGRTSDDYAKYRPGYPDSFYELLKTKGVGLPGQRILDLGTGTGELALRFAAQGAVVTAEDISANQIEAAKTRACKCDLDLEFIVRPAEHCEFPDGSFDAVTASMCWIYFDKPRLIPLLKRWLTPEGLLAITSLIWLPKENDIAHRTEEIICKHNPEWSGANFTENVDPIPSFFQLEEFGIKSFDHYRVEMPFTNESWRGRIRACRGVGASLPDDKVREVDAELDAYLRQYADETFTVTHSIAIRIFTK